MNPIALSFADGRSFFMGLAMFVVADLLLLRFRVGTIRAILTLLALIGVISVLISATPLPMWVYALWLIPALVTLVVENLGHSPQYIRVASAITVFVATAGLCFMEIPYHRLPRQTVRNGETIYVLGDSISAGIGTKDRCWPTVLGEITGIRVVNLAEPGATVQSATRQAERIPESSSVVIVEIGGNDLLSGTDANTFRVQIDALVSSLCTKHNRVLMFELPLFPFKNAFGGAQRAVAAKYGVALLPKRSFTKVLGLKDGTIDGLHLTQRGHNAMAAAIAKVLQKE